jgi:hypothetical protein
MPVANQASLDSPAIATDSMARNDTMVMLLPERVTSQGVTHARKQIEGPTLARMTAKGQQRPIGAANANVRFSQQQTFTVGRPNDRQSPLSDMQAEAPYRYSQVVNSGRG